jgi:preprotein translocase subunit SecA
MKLIFNEEKNQVELTDNGIKYLSGDTDADFSFTRYWNRNCQYRKKKLERMPKLRKKEALFKISVSKASVFILYSIVKAYSLKRCRICDHGQ